MRVDLKAAEQLRYGFMSGGSSTRKAVRPTAIGKRALTLKRFASGGMVTARASKHEKKPPGAATPGGFAFCLSALDYPASLAYRYYTLRGA